MERRAKYLQCETQRDFLSYQLEKLEPKVIPIRKELTRTNKEIPRLEDENAKLEIQIKNYEVLVHTHPSTLLAASLIFSLEIAHVRAEEIRP